MSIANVIYSTVTHKYMKIEKTSPQINHDFYYFFRKSVVQHTL